MQREVLVTTANGMFGHAVVRALLGEEGVRVRAMVRDWDSFKLEAANLDVVVADLDDPKTLEPALKGVTHVFLATPMDEHIAEREAAVVDAARASGGPHVLKLHGAVRHQGDELDDLHAAAAEYLKHSGLPWTLISPNSVMETSLLPYGELLKFDCIMGMSGEGKVGLVAAEDVALATRAIILGEGHEGQDYVLTGPQALSMAGVCGVFTQVLGRDIHYYDMPEDEFATMMIEHGGVAVDELELTVLCHLRAWKRGKADLVTDTYTKLTGEPPTQLDDWIMDHVDSFAARPSFGDRIAGFFIHQKYGRRGHTPGPHDDTEDAVLGSGERPGRV